MKKLILTLTVALGMASAKETGLIAQEKYRWTKGFLDKEVNLTVCWEQEGDVILIKDDILGQDLGNHEVRFIKTAIEKAVKGTWEKYAGITFTFSDGLHGHCDIQVNLVETGRSNTKIGRQTISKVNINPLHLRYLSYEAKGSSAQIVRDNVDWVTARAELSKDAAAFKAFLERFASWVAVHEFGHVIGFFHEHARSEEAAFYKDSPQIGGTAGSEAVAFYDKYSVMNYNNWRRIVKQVNGHWVAILQDRDGNDLPMNPQLSCGDVLAVRKMYPPHSSTNKASIAPCCTETGWLALMKDPSVPKNPFPTYAAFAARNISCFEQGGVRIGSGTGQNCISLAKAAGPTGDVCSTPITPSTFIQGDKIKEGCNYDVFANGSVPNFETTVSIFYKANQPYYRVKVVVTNLNFIPDGRLTEFWMFKVKTAGQEGFNYPPSFTLDPNCGFDAAAGRNGCTIEFPMGKGAYDDSKGCYCGYNSSPKEGEFAMFDAEEDKYLVDNSFAYFQFEYIINNGKTERIYQTVPNTCTRYPSSYSDSPYPLRDFVTVPLSVGDEFRVGSKWMSGDNKAPSQPGQPVVEVSDNGQPAMSVNWTGATDSDGDPIYYYVEVAEVHAGTFKKYKALQNTSLAISSGLKRNTAYQVRAIAFDGKDHSYGPFRDVKTLDRPEGCTQDNTEKVHMGSLPTDMIRSGINLTPYRSVPSGVTNTYFWTYPNSFCAEHNPGGLVFLDIPAPSDAAPTDWLWIESDKLVRTNLHYREGTGPESQVSPGTDINNDYSYGSGNFIRLGDYWGPDAKYYGLTNWRTAQKLTRIRIAIISNSTSRITSRFGRIMLFKENPTGLNYKGIRLNNALLTGADVTYPIYLNEPVEGEIFLGTNYVRYDGGFSSNFRSGYANRRAFSLARSMVLGANPVVFNAINDRYPTETQALRIVLEVSPNPTLIGICLPGGQKTRFLAPKRTYSVFLAGIIKPVRSLSMTLNGEPTPISIVEGGYRFTAPTNLKSDNEIVLQVDGVRLPPTRLPRINLTAIQTLLLD